MNKQLKVITNTIFLMFITLVIGSTAIQVVFADDLNNNSANQRTVKNTYKIQRGSILVAGDPIALSTNTNDDFKFKREYLQGAMYAPITGYFSHYQGSTGIEQKLNETLSGTTQSQLFTRVLHATSGQVPQGKSVELTINPKAQKVAFDALQGINGAVVALEPKTGRILAMASSPSYDPNLLSGNNDETIVDNYKKLDKDKSQPLVNRTIAGDLYHPGSTFKVLTVAAGLESGVIQDNTELDDPTEYNLPGTDNKIYNWNKTRCWTDGDKVSLERAIQNSCNIQMALIAEKLPLDGLTKQAKKFGFEGKFNIPMQVTPSVAPLPGNNAQKALSSFGQWDVQVTPMQMAMMYGGLANKGKVMRPYLVDNTITPDFKIEDKASPAEYSQAVTPATAEKVTKILKSSVRDGLARKAQISGIEVAGKTGTAENGNDAQGKPLPYTISFAGYAPADDPQVVVAVFIEDGGGPKYQYNALSSELPTKIGKQVMEAVLNK